MDERSLKKHIQEIVKEACELKDKHTDEHHAPVNYACIFSQSKEEYDELLVVAGNTGNVIKETSTGLLFQIEPLETVAGKLQLVKIRLPDRKRPEKGDADFTVPNFAAFKKRYLSKSGFRIIEREHFEMIELRDPAYGTLAYFSNPPLWKQLGVK